MYRIRDAATNALLEDVVEVRFVKQQLRVDLPIVCDDINEADGIIYDDGTEEKMMGIVGRNMNAYAPLVVVEEINGEPYLFEKVKQLEEEVKNAKEENKVLQEMSQAALGEILLFQAQQMQPTKGGV